MAHSQEQNLHVKSEAAMVQIVEIIPKLLNLRARVAPIDLSPANDAGGELRAGACAQEYNALDNASQRSFVEAGIEPSSLTSPLPRREGALQIASPACFG